MKQKHVVASGWTGTTGFNRLVCNGDNSVKMALVMHLLKKIILNKGMQIDGKFKNYFPGQDQQQHQFVQEQKISQNGRSCSSPGKKKSKKLGTCT